MKLHRILVDAVVSGLNQIFYQNQQADRVVETLLKSNKKWGARDRAFIAETIYENVRWWRKIGYVADISPKTTNDLWKMVAVWFWMNGIELPDWAELDGLDTASLEKNAAEAETIRAVRASIPDWLDTLGASQLGDKWNAEVHALNLPTNLFVRVNTLKISKEKLIEQFLLEDFEVEEVPFVNVALSIKNKKNIRANELFKKGFFEIQDAGSQAIAEFLQPNQNALCIDACAGAGGKTLHLAALMQNKGRVIALDVEEDKLKELEIRAKRNGVKIITTEIIKKETVEKHKNSAHFLLLDVPCSGLGVLRRNPDAKWRLSMQFIEKLQLKQAEILKKYSPMLRSGGKMVYATCSILPSENEQQVAKFLEENPDFTLLKDQTLLTSTHGFDGFYMALLQKK